eukprot:TRINITY_DN104087_c0_g1_i1.p1 TRINITY_DN104087_c0_g1~~TRINITY_DN104087_c0_g1_i1.p1  ORF type:complete len:398 (-),score=48.06 TRINITY_DN104087_c0_g1_i1:210-1403(-)
MDERTCEKCGVPVPVQNFELHEVRCRGRPPLPAARGTEAGPRISRNEHHPIPQSSAPPLEAFDGNLLPASHAWSCESCTLENDASAAVCAACDRPRSRAGSAAHATAPASASRPARIWACEHCTFENDAIHDKCAMCGVETRRGQRRRQDSSRGQAPEEAEELSDDLASSASGHLASMAMGTLAGGALGWVLGNNNRNARSAASSSAMGAATGAVLGSMMAPLFQEAAQPRQRRSASTGAQRMPRSGRPTISQGYPDRSHDDFFGLLQRDAFAPAHVPVELSRNRNSGRRRVVLMQSGDIDRFMQQMVEQMSEQQGPSLQPAQANCISSLPTHVLSAAEVQNLPPESTSCPICMEDFKEGDEQMTLPCFHKFHKGCSHEWLHRQGTCPICKHRVDGQ